MKTLLTLAIVALLGLSSCEKYTAQPLSFHVTGSTYEKMPATRTTWQSRISFVSKYAPVISLQSGSVRSIELIHENAAGSYTIIAISDKCPLDTPFRVFIQAVGENRETSHISYLMDGTGKEAWPINGDVRTTVEPLQ